MIEKAGTETVVELVENVDISDFVEESGALILKKLIMLLKIEYNFPLESTPALIQIRKFTFTSPMDSSS